jgi:DNA processing protein
MSVIDSGPAGPGACTDCLRRSWLLASLSTALDYRCGQGERLLELLALEDEQLLKALAGSRSQALRERYARFAGHECKGEVGPGSVCRHDPHYPRTLLDTGAPRMLNVRGGGGRFRALLAAPVVAILGTRRATDYGLEVAKSLARGLAASEVTVLSGLTDGIAAAAHAGALEVNAASLAVMDGGLDVACPARRRSLYERLCRTGCAVSELPCGCRGRRWGAPAAARVIARLADLTVVVEAGESPRELAGARIAQSLGRTVAAVPGRVTSAASGGTHALLIDGAALVRWPEDILDLLHMARPPAGTSLREQRTELTPGLESVLEQVGAGRDTAEKLIEGVEDSGEVLLALSELELIGLLARGDGGRYVPRGPPPPRLRPSPGPNRSDP